MRVNARGIRGLNNLTLNIARHILCHFFLNPAAFSAPAAGRWGTAGRNSITGPAQFGLNTGLARTFTWGPRLNLDWRIDATNVLNRETYTGVNSIIGGPQFGLPGSANTPRKIQSTMRLRF